MDLDVIYNECCVEGMRERIPGKSVDLVLTDPPYNINFKPPRDTGDEHFARDGIESDSMEKDDFMLWLDGVCHEINRVLKEDSYIFMFCGWSTIQQFHPVIEKYWDVKALHIWVKDNFGLGYYSRPQYEPFFMCLKGQPEKPDKAPSNVWDFRKVYKNKENHDIHSCQKPVSLLEKIIKCYASKEDEIIADPFMGNGSTAVAAYNMGLKWIGWEKDEEIYKKCMNRVEKHTSKPRLFYG